MGLSFGTLDIIEHDNRDKAILCCNAMLNKWLQVDTTASWEKLFTVIESLVMNDTLGIGMIIVIYTTK